MPPTTLNSEEPVMSHQLMTQFGNQILPLRVLMQ